MPSNTTSKTTYKTQNRIITLSDIHSDMHSLIVALRDCAKVIRKRCSVDINKIDISVEKFLEYDLNKDLIQNKTTKKQTIKDVPFYKDDLGYEWCGKQTTVVICGDFLDGFRPHFGNYRLNNLNELESRCNNNCIDLEYDQIEIKIFRFINILNKYAILQGCRIFKILGNHEFINLNNESINNYIPDWTGTLVDYYKGYSRKEYFLLENEGSELIFEDGAFMLLIINNNIFVHGQLDPLKTYNDYVKVNKILNCQNKKHEKEVIIRESSSNTTLWGRKYDRNSNKDKYGNTICHDNQFQHNKCIEIKMQLGKFIKDIPNYNYNIDDMRVIVGHCPQFIYKDHETINSTFTLKSNDGPIETLSLPVKTSTTNENIIFGIGMECDKKTLDSPSGIIKSGIIKTDEYDRYIYKVDVGSSRGFDKRAGVDLFQINSNTVEQEFKNINSRVSQVLEIKNNGISDEMKILRSTIKNTRIHQPRQMYESLIR